jgi:hypothetical protein
MLNDEEINALCREIAEETLDERAEEILAEIEEEELDNMMLALGPRAFGPDAGSDDCGGLFYWDLK